MPYIEVYLPNGRVEHFDFQNNSFTIGRSAEADITIHEPVISRVHIRIEKTGKNRWKVIDLDSRNHTFLGEDKIKSHVLTDKNVMFLGSVKFIYHDPSGDSDSPANETEYRKSKSKSNKSLLCPRCKSEMPDHAVVCMTCGHNIKTGKNHSPKTSASSGDSAIQFTPSAANTPKKSPSAMLTVEGELPEWIKIKKWILLGLIVLVLLIVLMFILF